MRKTRILGIAPYAGLKNMMDVLALQRKDIEMTTYLADLDAADTLLSRLEIENYDVILSRGGTALLLKRIAPIPVFDMKISYYDILNTINLARGMNVKLGIVAYPSIAGLTKQLCDILKYDIEIFVTHSWNDTIHGIDQMCTHGVKLIIGDMSACRYSREHGVSNMLITSGSETIRNGLEQIAEFARYYLDTHAENRLLRASLRSRGESVLLFDENHALLNSAEDQPDLPVRSEAVRLLRRLRHQNQIAVEKRRRNRTWHISGQKFHVSGQTYFCFHIAPSRHSCFLTGSIQRLDNQESTSKLFTYLFESNAYRKIRSSINDNKNNHRPFFLEGASGTGKDRLAQVIHSHHAPNTSPMFAISCSTFSEKELRHLADHADSLFYNDGCTFHFKNCDLLSPALADELISFIQATNMATRNLLLFSWQKKDHGATSPFHHDSIIQKLGCIYIFLPSLDSLMDELPNLIHLHINALNISTGLQISGIEPEAVSLLQGYPWKYNLDQLKRVIADAFHSSRPPYIKASIIADLLRQESLLTQGTELETSFKLNPDWSLKDITHQIALKVLQEEHFNQSKAAKRLNISRTTLWRLLKQHG